jgi:hypothetical protein
MRTFINSNRKIFELSISEWTPKSGGWKW